MEDSSQSSIDMVVQESQSSLIVADLNNSITTVLTVDFYTTNTVPLTEFENTQDT